MHCLLCCNLGRSSPLRVSDLPYLPHRRTAIMAKHTHEELEAGAGYQSDGAAEGSEGGEEEDSSSQDVSADIGSEDSESSDSEEDPEESSEEEDEDPEDNTVNVNLGFRDPTEEDFHGLKAQLQNYLDGGVFACSELVNTIINQSTVGTVVKSVGEEDDGTDRGGDPLGVISVLNTERYRQLNCLEEIKAYLLSRCHHPECKATLEKVWSGKHTGLIVHERLINCPQELAPPLLQALFDEIQWATEDEPEQLRDAFKFEHYVAVSRAFIDRDPAASALPAGQEKKKQKYATPVIVYIRREDEHFKARCSMSYHFSTGGVNQDGLEPCRLVMVLTKSQVQAARKELDSAMNLLGSTM